MAQLPKPPGQRIERGAKTGKWSTLPAAREWQRPPASPDRDWLVSTRSWWEALWASPMATTYQEADVSALVRLAEMVDERSRGQLGATETAAMTVLEDRFGLNPKSRRALQWEIEQAGAGGDAAEAPVDVPKLRLAK